MKKSSCSILSALLLVLIINSCEPFNEEVYLEEGVSKMLAIYRNATVEDVSYRLEFSIPAGKADPIAGSEIIELNLTSRRAPLVIDFRAGEDHLEALTVNGNILNTQIVNGHIVIPQKYLHRTYNRIEIQFRAGDMSLNRNDDYLYTLFVPDRASTAFPCFDQPDIKARYSLTLDIPSAWEAISNSPVSEIDTAAGRRKMRFAETRPLSTYLFAFAAGRFERMEKEVGGIKMEMLHREDRKEYIDNNSEEIFRLHYNALKWLEEYTGIKYPFDKFGFVLIPSFQYSGMEHPGSVFYRASSLLLESSPTLNERLSRAALIAHETSHIWFGDLVTMKWFDDVWLKEVFAGYMSDKIVRPDFPDVNHDLRFLLSRYPAAYEVDRTRGTNPIIQDLRNLKDAGSLYGGIIYNKAPIVMMHLEFIAGEENLKRGLQRYLSEYSYGNARWDDLIEILENETGKQLEEWSRIWVKEAGMPVIKTVIDTIDGRFRISFQEDDPAGTMRHWPQELSAMVMTTADTITFTCTAGDNDSFILTDNKPVCVIPDVSAKAYGSFIPDSISLAFLIQHINDFSDPLVRAALWISLNENMVNYRLSGSVFLNMLLEALGNEQDIQLRNYLAGRYTSTYWNYVPAGERMQFTAAAEELGWSKITAENDPSLKRSWLTFFRSVALSDDGLRGLEKIWRTGELPGGVKLSEDELCMLALNLALKKCTDSKEILAAQRERISSDDRLRRFDFVMPAVSHEQAVRDAFFESLQDPVNREHEPWVLEALGYLHHPLMADSSEKYILPSLEMLEEIKATGDIFFPAGWISVSLEGHQSPAVADIVEKFLHDHPLYPSDLRLKILQAADHLLREKL